MAQQLQRYEHDMQCKGRSEGNVLEILPRKKPNVASTAVSTAADRNGSQFGFRGRGGAIPPGRGLRQPAGRKRGDVDEPALGQLPLKKTAPTSSCSGACPAWMAQPLHKLPLGAGSHSAIKL